MEVMMDGYGAASPYEVRRRAEERRAVVDAIPGSWVAHAAILEAADAQGVTLQTIRRWLNEDPRVVVTRAGPARAVS